MESCTSLCAGGTVERAGESTALYLDLLICLGHVAPLATDTDGREIRTNISAGLVGAEFGLKFLVGKYLLVQLGLPPTYWFGTATFPLFRAGWIMGAVRRLLGVFARLPGRGR
jgi:hypothetical protein